MFNSIHEGFLFYTLFFLYEEEYFQLSAMETLTKSLRDYSSWKYLVIIIFVSSSNYMFGLNLFFSTNLWNEKVYCSFIISIWIVTQWNPELHNWLLNRLGGWVPHISTASFSTQLCSNTLQPPFFVPLSLQFSMLSPSPIIHIVLEFSF